MHDKDPHALWSWPARAGHTANALDRLALEPVTLDGRGIARRGTPPHALWAEGIDRERSPLHMVAFSKDLSPRAGNGAPVAMHQRLAIEAMQTTGRAVPGGEYVPAVPTPEAGRLTTIPAGPDDERPIALHRVDNAETCPDPRGIDAYRADVMLARCIDVIESNADPRIPGLHARIEALNTLTGQSGVDVAVHDRETLRASSDGRSVAIPDPGRLPLDQAMHWLHGAAIGLTRQVANDTGHGPDDRNLEMLAAAWTAGHTTQNAAGLHTLRCDETLAAAAATIRDDPVAFRHAVELAAATEERLLAPARRDRGLEQSQ
ncbi:MAG: hypothetical protein OXG72_02070, partial [Acidobacteria bacterium]|nr:hypothetical protein [Acidobacteriota bacterium]